MQPLLPAITEKGFPLEVRKRSNEHSRLLKRQKIIQYGETALPKWEQTDADETITLPMSLKRAASISGRRDFHPYVASVGAALKLGMYFGNITPNGLPFTGVDPFPSQFRVTGVVKPFITLNVTEGGLAYFRVTVDPEVIIDPELPPAPVVTAIDLLTGSELPDSTDTAGYMTAATYEVTGGVLTVLNSEGIGSQVYGYCGGAHYFDAA